MGRRLSAEGQAAIVADVATRLAPVLTAAAQAPKVDVQTIATLLGAALASTGVDVSAPDTATTLVDAARDLILAQAPTAAPDARTAWITRYFAPTSRRQLPGAATLWTRAVNLQRDKQRRAKFRQIEGCPVRLTLSSRHRELLGREVGNDGHQTAGALVGKLIERQYGRLPSKKQQPPVPQKALDL